MAALDVLELSVALEQLVALGQERVRVESMVGESAGRRLCCRQTRANVAVEVKGPALRVCLLLDVNWSAKTAPPRP